MLPTPVLIKRWSTNLELVSVLLFWKQFLQLIRLGLCPVQLLLDGLDFGGYLGDFLSELLDELVHLRVGVKVPVAGGAAGLDGRVFLHAGQPLGKVGKSELVGFFGLKFVPSLFHVIFGLLQLAVEITTSTNL